MSDKLTIIRNQIVPVGPSFEQLQASNKLQKLDFAKELEFACQIFKANEYLQGATPESIQNSIKNVALSGLSLNPVLKYAYLVPRYSKKAGLQCCLDIGYVGLVKILTDTGSVLALSSGVVHQNDTFDYEPGAGGFVKHKLCLTGDRGRPVAAYSKAILPNQLQHIEIMTWAEVMAIKARSESVKKGVSSPWNTDESEMAKKTVIKRHFKFLPKSDRAEEIGHVIDIDNQLNGIDFEAERAAANTPPPAAGAEAVLMADQDSLDLILTLLQSPALGELIFDRSKNKAKMVAKIQSDFAQGMTSERMHALIQAVKADILTEQAKQDQAPAEPVEAVQEAQILETKLASGQTPPPPAKLEPNEDF